MVVAFFAFEFSLRLYLFVISMSFPTANVEGKTERRA